MIDVQTDISRFTATLASVARTVGATSFAPGGEGQRFMRFQAIQLNSTLINVMPPKKKPGLEKRLKKKVGEVFVADFRNSTVGSENVWLFSSSNFLYGVPRDYDQRGIGVGEAARLLYSNQHKPTEERAFKTYKPRKQRIKIFRKWLVSKATKNQLVKKLVRHAGRLKAGFLPARDGLGGPRVQEWIERHHTGARGSFTNNLGAIDNPNVLIRNFAKGAGNPRTGIQVHAALKIRMRAMVTDMRLIIAGKKQKGWLN